MRTAAAAVTPETEASPRRGPPYSAAPARENHLHPDSSCTRNRRQLSASLAECRVIAPSDTTGFRPLARKHRGARAAAAFLGRHQPRPGHMCCLAQTCGKSHEVRATMLLPGGPRPSCNAGAKQVSAASWVLACKPLLGIRGQAALAARPKPRAFTGWGVRCMIGNARNIPDLQRWDLFSGPGRRMKEALPR